MKSSQSNLVLPAPLNDDDDPTGSGGGTKPTDVRPAPGEAPPAE